MLISASACRRCRLARAPRCWTTCASSCASSRARHGVCGARIVGAEDHVRPDREGASPERAGGALIAVDVHVANGGRAGPPSRPHGRVEALRWLMLRLLRQSQFALMARRGMTLQTKRTFRIRCLRSSSIRNLRVPESASCGAIMWQTIGTSVRYRCFSANSVPGIWSILCAAPMFSARKSFTSVTSMTWTASTSRRPPSPAADADIGVSAACSPASALAASAASTAREAAGLGARIAPSSAVSECRNDRGILHGARDVHVLAAGALDLDFSGQNANCCIRVIWPPGDSSPPNRSHRRLRGSSAGAGSRPHAGVSPAWIRRIR